MKIEINSNEIQQVGGAMRCAEVEYSMCETNVLLKLDDLLNKATNPRLTNNDAFKAEYEQLAKCFGYYKGDIEGCMPAECGPVLTNASTGS